MRLNGWVARSPGVARALLGCEVQDGRQGRQWQRRPFRAGAICSLSCRWVAKRPKLEAFRVENMYGKEVAEEVKKVDMMQVSSLGSERPGFKMFQEDYKFLARKGSGHLLQSLKEVSMASGHPTDSRKFVLPLRSIKGLSSSPPGTALRVHHPFTPSLQSPRAAALRPHMKGVCCLGG